MIDRSNWKKILDIANFLIMPEIVEECSRFAEMWISVENCIDTWQFAIVQHLLTLKESTYDYVCAYFEKVIKI